MPLASKILFALSLLSILITVVVVILQSFRYKKEVKAYKIVLRKLEKEESKRLRMEKEAEVIRRFNEFQKQMEGSEQNDGIQATHYQTENY